MKHLTASEEQQIAALKAQIQKLQTQLGGARKTKSPPPQVAIKLVKSQARFKRVKKKGERDSGIGEFFLEIDVTAGTNAIYIPLSIASGKKATGFIYQIEGPAEGNISTAEVTSRGDGITKITLGTILYTKIPAGKTASFRVLIEITGAINKKFKVVITRINYKLSPSDARYVRYEEPLSSKEIRFD